VYSYIGMADLLGGRKVGRPEGRKRCSAHLRPLPPRRRSVFFLPSDLPTLRPSAAYLFPAIIPFRSTGFIPSSSIGFSPIMRRNSLGSEETRRHSSWVTSRFTYS
jgi:hypothetical protein